jgi:hypothetical protein
MKALKKMGRDTGTESFFIRMVVCMRGIGIRTKWKVMELFTMNLEKLLMKVNGKMINFMAKGNSITKTHSLFKILSITAISTMLMITGHCMRESFLKI